MRFCASRFSFYSLVLSRLVPNTSKKVGEVVGDNLFRYSMIIFGWLLYAVVVLRQFLSQGMLRSMSEGLVFDANMQQWLLLLPLATMMPLRAPIGLQYVSSNFSWTMGSALMAYRCWARFLSSISIVFNSCAGKREEQLGDNKFFFSGFV